MNSINDKSQTEHPSGLNKAFVKSELQFVTQNNEQLSCNEIKEALSELGDAISNAISVLGKLSEVNAVSFNTTIPQAKPLQTDVHN